MCQEFDTCLARQGMHMIVRTLEQRGSQELCLLPWCYCGDTVLVVWKPTGFNFQLLSEISQLWQLSCPFFKQWKSSSHVRKSQINWVLFALFTSSSFLVKNCTKAIKLLKFDIIFCSFHEFLCKSFFCTALSFVMIFIKILFFEILLSVPEFKLIKILNFYLCDSSFCGSKDVLWRFAKYTSFLHSPSLPL